MQEEIFEYILEKRLNFGSHQIRQFFIISLIDFLDGAEFFFQQLLTPTLKSEWNLTLTELVIFGSAFNFGLMIGSAICGFLADSMGRKNILILGTVLQTTVVLFTVITQNIVQMTILRLIYGIVIGMNLPISSILMIEVTPKQNRGKIVVSLHFIILLGRVWVMFLGYIFMQTISSGNWRAISFCNSIPCILCLIGTLIWIQESPRYLILHNQLRKGIENINNIGKMNHSDFQNLNEQEIQLLEEWALNQKEQHDHEAHSIKQLFNSENLKITWRNYSLNFLFMFTLLVIYNLIPFILDKENKSLLHLFALDFGEVPAVFLMLFSIDSYGRLQTLMFSSGILAITLLSIWYWKWSIIVFGLVIFKFCSKVNLGTYNVLFAESYHTLYRSLGLGTTNAMGRIAGSIAPFVAFPIFFTNNYLPFLICSVTAFITFLILSCYPIDLTKKPLDQLKRE